jgi:predicted nucleic acid-binding protein
MSYLVDTNIVSEIAQPKPEPLVLEWLDEIPPSALHMSVLTLGEIRRGVESLASGRKRERLRLWLEQVLRGWFEERILPVDEIVADRWGRLTASAGRPLPAVDSLIAATALAHNLRLVTRNTKDFKLPGLEVVNPWSARQ